MSFSLQATVAASLTSSSWFQLIVKVPDSVDSKKKERCHREHLQDSRHGCVVLKEFQLIQKIISLRQMALQLRYTFQFEARSLNGSLLVTHSHVFSIYSTFPWFPFSNPQLRLKRQKTTQQRKINEKQGAQRWPRDPKKTRGAFFQRSPLTYFHSISGGLSLISPDSCWNQRRELALQIAQEDSSLQT